LSGQDLDRVIAVVFHSDSPLSKFLTEWSQA